MLWVVCGPVGMDCIAGLPTLFYKHFCIKKKLFIIIIFWISTLRISAAHQNHCGRWRIRTRTSGALPMSHPISHLSHHIYINTIFLNGLFYTDYSYTFFIQNFCKLHFYVKINFHILKYTTYTVQNIIESCVWLGLELLAKYAVLLSFNVKLSFKLS